MNLTPHFTLEEFTESQNASRLGLDNTPSVTVLANLYRTAAMIEAIRMAIDTPIRISSGYRSPEVNKAAGGSTTSAHMFGLAADINAQGISPKDLAKIIAKMDFPIDQIILEFPESNGWVHIGLSSGAPRKEVLTKRVGTPYMQGIC